MTARPSLVVALWVVLVFSGLFAVDALFTGLTFGFALWDAHNPEPTVLWLGVLIAPCIAALALKGRHTSTTMLALALAGTCALDAVWIVPALGQ